MKQIVKALCLAALFLGLGTAAQAQFHQSVYLNGNIPTGDFASDASAGPTLHPSYTAGVPLTYEQVGKDASVSFGIGYRASYAIEIDETVGSVSPFANIDILWNTIGGAWGDKYDDAYFSSPTYFNIPLMAGVNFTYIEVAENITPFGEFALGTDLLWITAEGTDKLPDGSNYRFAYKPTFAFSWMIGAGAFFGQHISAGLYYYGLGKHTIDYTDGTLDDNTYARTQLTTNDAAGKGRQQRTVGSFMLRIGFHF